ncbi:DUF6455 family protein [Leisingera sp. JC1]|uniref:DUF6455 family protein n=1 Tax=Leisingera sp. JC1 TaxID=1855282 RepID=UPI0008030F38|nr:DUF6455 family protein [Leisingera sp. JC1]OBY24301.1 hypothetical protein A9D60_09915 [Leisingera sp. JC1]
MKPLGEPLRHLRLMSRMGETIGADLSGALAAGRLSNQEWANMVTRCRGCSAPDRCAAFLSEHEEASAPMPGCRNADQLMQLKGRRA